MRRILSLLLLSAVLFSFAESSNFSFYKSSPNARAADDEPVLIWYHNTTREFAKGVIVAELKRRKAEKDVQWRGYYGTVSIALGLALSVNGYITDDEIVVEKCTGSLSKRALSEIRRVLNRLFPLGYDQSYSFETLPPPVAAADTNDPALNHSSDTLEIPFPQKSENSIKNPSENTLADFTEKSEKESPPASSAE